MHHIFLCFIICVLTVFGCTNIPQPIPDPQPSHMTEKTPLPRSKAGYVYIIENVKTMGRGIYKIGMTQREDPNERIKEIGDSSVPFQFDVIYLLKTADCRALEKYLHYCFKDKRLNENREFFKLTRNALSTTLKAAQKTHTFLVITSPDTKKIL